MESLGVLLLHPVNAYLEQELDRRCRLYRFWESPREEFLRAHAGAVRAVVGNANYGADAALIDALPALEIVASFSVGIDRVDLAKCRERGIRVTNTPDVLTDDVADLAVGLAIAVLRRIPQADRYVRAGLWKSRGDYTLTTRVRRLVFPAPLFLLLLLINHCLLYTEFHLFLAVPHILITYM